MGVTSLSTAPYPLLATTFHSRPWFDTVHEHQHRWYRGGMFSCTLLSCGKTISPCLWILCKIHRWWQQNPKSVFPSEIQARLLTGTSLIKFFPPICLYKEDAPRAFSSTPALQKCCLFPRLSVPEGSSLSCVQHKACSRLSPDQPSRDNQVRWSNGPPGP